MRKGWKMEMSGCQRGGLNFATLIRLFVFAPFFFSAGLNGFSPFFPTPFHISFSPQHRY